MDLEERLKERVVSELDEIDMDERYRDMLDECYSLARVGGPFAGMLASRVLEECDPIAYRCGRDDWEDGEIGATVEEIGGGYYDKYEVDAIRAELEDE